MFFREWRNLRRAKDMIYPQGDQPKHEWYMMTLPSAPEDREKTNKYNMVWICFGCVGHQGWHDYKGLKLSDPNFKNKWLALISEAKERIDALNSQPEDGIVGQICAECSADALPGDFLCQECRDKV